MKTIVCILTFLVLIASSASAAAYMKIGDIEGESQRVDYEGWIVISGLELDITREGIANYLRGRARSRARVEPIDVYKELDKATPYLMLATLQGKTFDEVEIHFVRDSGEARLPFLKYTFSNVSLSSYGTSAGADERPTESLSLNFEKIKVVYVEQADDHSAGDEHEITYDIAAGV